MLPVNYLDRAVSALRRLGIDMQTEQGAPVVAILEKIARYDNAKVASIASTLQQSSSFNAAVREQIAGMYISTRYADIAGRFNSIDSYLSWYSTSRYLTTKRRGLCRDRR